MQVFGALLATFLVVVAFGLMVLLSRYIAPGVGMHMVRCVTPDVIWGANMSKSWVYIIGDVVAALVHALFMKVVPPHHVQVCSSRRGCGTVLSVFRRDLFCPVHTQRHTPSLSLSLSLSHTHTHTHKINGLTLDHSPRFPGRLPCRCNRSCKR